MRVIVQRVLSAEVRVDGRVCGKIGKGFLLLIGIRKGDTPRQAELLWKKIRRLRIFDDAEGKTNLSLADVQGEVLSVSQFTLYANTKKGNRPSFLDAAGREEGNAVYEAFLDFVEEDMGTREKGEFGADMKIHAVLDGPFTIQLEEEAGTEEDKKA